MDLSLLRRSAAELAALAVYELYPNVELRGGGETPTGFFYDFSVPYPIQEQVVEEKMRQIVREKRPVRTLEMVPFSAIELLKKEGHFARLSEVEEEGLVELIQIGDTFYDICPAPHVKNTAELAAFKISVEPGRGKEVRLIGYCHVSKDLLKDYLKKLAHYQAPQQIGEALGLWRGAIWLPEGLKWKRKLLDFLKESWFGEAFEIAGAEEREREKLHRSLGKNKVAEIYSKEGQKTAIYVSFFDQSETAFISSLQLIGKTLTILGFDHFTQNQGRVVSYVVKDGIDRLQPIVQVTKRPKKGTSQIDFTLQAELEPILHLLLEKNLLVNVENK